ncbi:MAG: hypothetical protein J6U31_08705 [Bacteroidales bacterium]|nr:hypothetical protein [Bacteroidales bacterium]
MKKFISILILVLTLCMQIADLEAQSLTFKPHRGSRDSKLESAKVKQKKEKTAKSDTVTFAEPKQQGRKSLKFRTRAKKGGKKEIEAVFVPEPETTVTATESSEPSVSAQTDAEPTVLPARTPSWEHQDVVAVILPFYLESANTKQDEMQMRMVEFYKGFLLAVNEAQLKGHRIKVLTYDLTTQPLSDILTDESLLEARTIVAPMNGPDVDQVALFGESHGIPVISPFSFRKEQTDNPFLLQLNAPKTSFYTRLNEELIDRFSTYRFVFVRDTLFDTNLDVYPEQLKLELNRQGIEYSSYTFHDPYSVACMDSVLNLTGSNILYVLETPTADVQAQAMLRRFFPSLKNKLFLDANPAIAKAIGASYAMGEDQSPTAVSFEQTIPDSLLNAALPTDSIQTDSLGEVIEDRQIAVLGYPEWQKYTSDFMDYFYDLNVWMFTKFYANPFDPKVEAFYSQFRYWYNCDLLPLFPKYGMLGYDVGVWTMSNVGQTTGRNNAGSQPIETLQSVINFEQEDGHGALNTGFCLVHFTSSSTVEKFEIR